MSSSGVQHSRRDHPTDDFVSEQTPLLEDSQGSSKAHSSVETELDGGSDGLADDDGHTTANQSITAVRGSICAVALGLLIFLQATNISLLTTIQSDIANDLDAFEKTSWFTSSYLIAMSALAPLSGKLSSIFSPRKCIFVATVVLAVGSSISSVAHNFETFVTGRVITGIGASGIFTISIIIVLELTGSKRRGLAIGLLNSGYTIGVALGATAAGALLPVVGWRALFYSQAPIAITGGTVLLLTIPHDFTAGKKGSPAHSALRLLSRLDYLGALSLTASIVLFLYALSSPSRIPILPLILSGLVLLIFVLCEVYIASDPIIPIHLLQSRGLLLTCLGTIGYMAARWSVLFYVPTYAIAVRQWSPAAAGSALIPTNIGFVLGSLAVGWLHIKGPGSYYVPSLAVYALFPATLFILSGLATQRSSSLLLISTVFACGAVTGAALNYQLAHVLHLTPKSTHYVATSLIATTRGIAGSFGSAIGGGLFTRQLRASLNTHFAEREILHQEALVRRLLGSPGLVRELADPEVKAVAVQGYEEALRALWLAAGLLAVAMVFVQAGTGWKTAEEPSVLEEDRQDDDDGR